MDGSAFLWYIEVKDTAKKRRKQNMDQKEIEADRGRRRSL